MRRAAAFALLFLAVALVVGCSGGGPLEEAMDASAEAGSRQKAVAVATPAAEDGRESTVGTASSDAAEHGVGAAGPFGSEPRAEGGRLRG